MSKRRRDFLFTRIAKSLGIDSKVSNKLQELYAAAIVAKMRSSEYPINTMLGEMSPNGKYLRVSPIKDFEIDYDRLRGILSDDIINKLEEL